MSGNHEGLPYYHDTQSRQDISEQFNPYDNFVANDGCIGYKDFQQLFATPLEDNSQWRPNVNYYHSSMECVAQPYGTGSPTAAADAGNNLGVGTTGLNAEYGVEGAHVGHLSNDFGNKYGVDSGLFSMVQPLGYQQNHQPQLQGERRDEFSSVNNQLESSSSSVAYQNKPRRPALIALASSDEHSTTSTTSSGSLHVRSEREITGNPSSPSERKPRRGRPPLYPPLPKYEYRPHVTLPETSRSSEPSQPPTSMPVSPGSTSPPGSAAALKPRRGRPRLYSRPFSTPTSSQEITREQNRLAARRFRNRQDACMATLNSHAEDLELKNKDLKEEVARLREERLGLRGGMLEHGNCGCDFVDKYLKEETWRIGNSKGDDVDGRKNSVQEEQHAMENEVDQCYNPGSTTI